MKMVARGEASYWSPEYPTFPAIDAVARCTVHLRTSTKPIEAIALLQMTVSDTKTVDLKLMKNVTEQLGISEDASAPPVILLFVTPPDHDLTVHNVPENMATFVAKYNALLPSAYHSR